MTHSARRAGRCQKIPLISASSSTAARFAVVVIVLCVISWTGPAFGLWLPWASERDKIDRRLNEIWSALINKDDWYLGQYITGSRTATFVEDERKVIKAQRIEEVKIRVNNVRFDPRTGRMAFVVFKKTVVREDGKEISETFMRVMKKDGGEWRLITDAPRTRADKERKKKKRMRIERLKTQTYGNPEVGVTHVTRSRLVMPDRRPAKPIVEPAEGGS